MGGPVENNGPASEGARRPFGLNYAARALAFGTFIAVNSVKQRWNWQSAMKCQWPLPRLNWQCLPGAP